MQEPKLYQSVWSVVVLSGFPPDEPANFEDLVYQIDEGHAIGSYSLVERQEISGTPAVAQACAEVGHDASFFSFPLNAEPSDL
jgi:hypothetical protein